MGFCRSRPCKLSSAVSCWPKDIGEHAVLPAYYTLGNCNCCITAYRNTHIRGWQRREEVGARTLLHDGEKRPLLKTVCTLSFALVIDKFGSMVKWLGGCCCDIPRVVVVGLGSAARGQANGGRPATPKLPRAEGSTSTMLCVSEGKTNTRIGYICGMYEL